jgi:hypothetical protein
MTPEQKKALALATARKRLADQQAGMGTTPMPQVGPDGMTTAERIAAAKSGTLAPPSDARLATVNAFDNVAELQMNTPANDPSAFGAFMGNLAPGLTFGAADEIAAGVGSMIEGRPYADVLDGLRGQEEVLRTEQPMASLAGNIAGAVAPGVAGVGLVSGARSLPAAVGRGMGFGAAAGGAQGFLTGEDGLANRMMGAGIGAGMGAALGGAIPLVGAGIQRAARAGSDMLRGSRVGNEIGGQLGVSNNAGRVIGDLLSPEDPAAMRAAMATAGPRAMLADASPTTGAMLDATLRSPTTGARLAGERVAARAANAGDEIIDALSGGMQGPRQGVASVMEGIRTGTAGARSSAYDAAYAKPIDYASPAGAKLLDDVSPRIPGEAISYANRLMKLRGEKSPQIMASIADDGTVTFTNPPDVRQWDYIKQALDGLAESGDGAGALGGQTRMGSAYQGLAKEIRDSVKKLVPEYGVALDTAADAITRRNAVQFGADLLSPRVTTEEALAEIATATGGQKAAMRDGLRGQVDEVIGNVKAVGSDQNIDARQALKAFTDFSSPNARRKMEALFGDEWPAIVTKLDEAGAALGLRARTAANSATNQRTLVQETITDVVEPNALMKGKPFATASDAFATLMNANPAAIKRMGRDVQGEIADLLTREGQGPQAVTAIVDALAKNPINTAAGKATRKVIEALLFSTTGQTTEAGLEKLGMRGQ